MRAEIRVSAVAGNANDPVSRVTLNTSDVAPLDHDDGVRPLLGVKTIDAVHIELFAHEGMCWYLDSNHLQVAQAGPNVRHRALMVFLYLLFHAALGVVWLLWRGCHFVKKARQYHVRAAPATPRKGPRDAPVLAPACAHLPTPSLSRVRRSKRAPAVARVGPDGTPLRDAAHADPLPHPLPQPLLLHVVRAVLPLPLLRGRPRPRHRPGARLRRGLRRRDEHAALPGHHDR